MKGNEPMKTRLEEVETLVKNFRRMIYADLLMKPHTGDQDGWLANFDRDLDTYVQYCVELSQLKK
jgi:hypothetical protein